MKQFLLRLVILAGISFLPTVSNAQLREKAEELLSTTLGNEPKEPVTSTDTFSLDEQHRKDSIKMQELALQLQEMKLNEILLKDELESTKNSNATADSLKMAEQRNRIDSLRALTPGVPVVVEGDTLFHLYAKRGGRTPVDRAEDILNIMVKIIHRIEERVARDKYVSTSELDRILREEIASLLEENHSDDNENWDLPSDHKPYVILVVGVNGVGKTTTIGKLAYQFKKAGKKVYLGAADTFRAAAVEQISIWGDRVGVPVVKQQMGSDPASVAFDTLQSAKANGADVVLIDTAGRLHNKVNLMNELKKIKEVMKKVMPEAPDEVMLVLDGSTGQNAFEQAKQFAAVTNITSLAITKLDGTAKGGVVIGISDQLKVPVKYIGLGEGMEDMQLFNKKEFVDSLFKKSK